MNLLYLVSELADEAQEESQGVTESALLVRQVYVLADHLCSLVAWLESGVSFFPESKFCQDSSHNARIGCAAEHLLTQIQSILTTTLTISTFSECHSQDEYVLLDREPFPCLNHDFDFSG